MSEFYLNLPSNTNKSLGAHRENTSSEFRIRLPTDIHLKGQWEVALVEAQHPYSWDNVPLQSEGSILSNELVVVETATGNATSVYLWPGYYDNIDHLLAAIHYYKDHPEKKFLKDAFQMSFSLINRRVNIKLKEGCELLLSQHLAYILGFKSTTVNSNSTAQYPPDMRGGIDSLYVYCDLVSPQIVGDSMQPLLRILPVGGHYGDVVHRVFVAPHYMDVLQKDFSSVTITIKTDRDLPVPFKFGKSVMKLHFRRKQI